MTKDELWHLNNLNNSIDRLNALANAIREDIPIMINTGNVVVELPWNLRTDLKTWALEKAKEVEQEFEKL